MNEWDIKFIELSKYIATWSKDTSTKIGAVLSKDNIILSVGYNRFPTGVNENIIERFERPQKYLYTEHAERLCIFNANKNGISINGCSIYINKLFPCVDCARAIIQSGISRVICKEPDFNNETWGENFRVSHEILNEAGIELIYHNL